MYYQLKDSTFQSGSKLAQASSLIVEQSRDAVIWKMDRLNCRVVMSGFIIA